MSHSILQVIAGVLYNEHQQILIAKRPLNKPLGGLWEFPGGKIEHSETPFVALKRELFEEIGINVIAAEPFTEITYPSEKHLLHLLVWKVSEFSGVARGREGQEIRWESKAKLMHYDFPPANKTIIDLLAKVEAQI